LPSESRQRLFWRRVSPFGVRLWTRVEVWCRQQPSRLPDRGASPELPRLEMTVTTSRSRCRSAISRTTTTQVPSSEISLRLSLDRRISRPRWVVASFRRALTTGAWNCRLDSHFDHAQIDSRWNYLDQRRRMSVAPEPQAGRDDRLARRQRAALRLSD